MQIVATGIPFVFTIAPTLITSFNRQRALTKIYLYGLLINLLTNIFLIYFYKSEGAAVAGVITYGYIFIASNYYLIVHKFIKFSGTFKIFGWQLIFFGICYITKSYILQDIYWIISLTIISILFVLMNLIFVITKNDLRIVREILNIKKFPVRIYRK